MAMVTIGTTALPNPSDYKVSMYDLDSQTTNRSETGLLLRDRVRAGIYKLTYKVTVNRTTMSSILALVAPDHFSVTFFDTTTGGMHTSTMYVGDRDCELRVLNSETDPNGGYWDVSFDLIEY